MASRKEVGHRWKYPFWGHSTVGNREGKMADTLELLFDRLRGVTYDEFVGTLKGNMEGHYANCCWAYPKCTEGPDTCMCSGVGMSLHSLRELVRENGGHFHYCVRGKECVVVTMNELDEFLIRVAKERLW